MTFRLIHIDKYYYNLGVILMSIRNLQMQRMTRAQEMMMMMMMMMMKMMMINQTIGTDPRSMTYLPFMQSHDVRQDAGYI